MIDALLSSSFKNSRVYEHFLLVREEYKEVLEKILLIDENYKLELENMTIICQYDSSNSDKIHFQIELMDRLLEKYYLRITDGNEVILCSYIINPETDETIPVREIRMIYYTKNSESHNSGESCFDIRNFSQNQLSSGTLIIYNKDGKIKNLKNYDTTQNQQILDIANQLEDYQINYTDHLGTEIDLNEQQYLPYGISLSNLTLKKKI